MIGPRSTRRRLGPAALLAAAGLAPAAAPQAPPDPAIAWEAPGAVRGLGLPAATVEAMAAAAPGDARWPTFLAVRVADADGSVPADRPAILGAYRLEPGRVLAFRPRFPLDAARPYRATFDPDGPLGPLGAITADRAAIPRPPTDPTVVVRVEPAGDRLPANLLKFYLYFSAPMGRGEAYARLALVDDAGRPLDHPFLELGEELWDATGTRLTVLLDPGRIKRGLRPRAELGPIFHAGRAYTLQVDPAWRDARGQPLGRPASRAFATAPDDESSPDPRAWAILPPRAESAAPLVVRFGDTLDRATVASGLALLDPHGVAVPGTAEAAPDGASWRLTPDRPWVAGEYALRIDTDLEDLAGNSIRRPFEVDIQRDVPVAPIPAEVRLPVRIGR